MTFWQDFSQWGRKKVQRVSHSPDDLRASFLQYITGRLPEPDRTRFEELLLEDQDFSDAAAACEQELIDNYVLHRLDEEDARAIGLWIEASPERVERVTMARALLQATPQTRRKKKTNIALAAAASLLVAATLYLVNTKMLRHEQSTTQLSAANTAPQNPAPPAAATTKPDIVLIAAERTRGEQKTATYQVHRENPIQLQVVLPGETAHSGYQLRIASLADQSKTLLQQNDLEAQLISGQLYLTVTLPPGSLPPATYTASISRHGDTLVSTFTLKWISE